VLCGGSGTVRERRLVYNFVAHKCGYSSSHRAKGIKETLPANGE